MADATLTGISDLAAGMLSVVTAAVVSLACRPREGASSVDAEVHVFEVRFDCAWS